MKKVNNKKGFTLAELLVVLAILAVLVAVAIPLFTGAIGQAEETAKNANFRALRAAAVTEILTANPTPAKGDAGWTATADVHEDGAMENLVISAAADASADKTFVASGSSKVAGKYTVVVDDVK